MTTPASPSVDFDRNRLRQGELIAGISGLVLLISLWMDWYGIDVGAGGFHVSVSVNAWDSFSIIDIILFLTALIAIGVAALRGLNRMPEMPYSPAMLVTGAGGLSLILILFRTISPPADGLSRKYGLFLGLISAAGIVYGGWRTMQETGESFSSLGGRGGAGPSAPTQPMGPPAGGAGGVGEGKAGPGAPHPGTSTGAPGGGAASPPPSAPDPVPGTTAPRTPPGIAGEPPPGEGTHPPGV